MDINQEVSSEVYFYLADGRCLKSVTELVAALESMEDWVFNHHVNNGKNDFSNWIGDIYGEAELANKIRKQDKKGTIKVIKVTIEKSLKQAKKKGKEVEGSKMKKITAPKKKTAILKMLKAA